MWANNNLCMGKLVLCVTMTLLYSVWTQVGVGRWALEVFMLPIKVPFV